MPLLEVPTRMERLGEPIMTGYRSQFFRHSCDDKGCYYQQLPCWDDLIESFPRRIRPTDIDGMVEIRGNILFLEEKRPGAGPDKGQRLALRALARRERITVAFFRPGKSSELDVLIYNQDGSTGWQPYTREQFGFWLKYWAQDADENPYLAAA